MATPILPIENRRVTDEFEQCPRYDKHELNDEQIDLITTRAATKALAMAESMVYQAVGKGIISKLNLVVGWGTVTLLMWLAATGRIRFPWEG